MSVEKYLIEQLCAHPSTQPQDVVKLCYQAARGAEHLLADSSAAEKYFLAEFESTPAGNVPLFENISDHVARVNLAAWKQRGLPAQWLFSLFTASARLSEDGEKLVNEHINAAGKLISQFSFSAEKWQEYITDYKKRGMPSVHHSDEYRLAEKPAYRIVRRSWLRLIPLLEKIAACKAKPCVVAIDGRAGSGKSTLAEQLAFVLKADIVHMDDFFLPPELRSEERLAQPGGNIHYERFKQELLPLLDSGEPFTYRCFSCSQMKLDGSREIRAGEYIIVEGSYSLHPEFGEYADVKAFCHVEPAEQLRRLRERDGEYYAEMFRSTWIPMEEKYICAFDVLSKCDVIM